MMINKHPEQVELSTDVIQRLLSVPDKRSLIGKRDLAILRIVLETGVRVGELINLRVGHLVQNQDDFSIQVKTLKKRKLRNSSTREKLIIREIPLLKETANALFNYWRHEYGAMFPDDFELPFFRTMGNGPYEKVPLTVKAVRELIKRLKLFGGITARITPHTFRHTFISRVARLNDLETARQLAGHESIVSTQEYLHSSLRLKREAVERLNYDEI